MAKIHPHILKTKDKYVTLQVNKEAKSEKIRLEKGKKRV